MRRVLAFVIALALLLLPARSRAGKLGDFEGEIEKEPPKAEKPGPSGQEDTGSDKDDDEEAWIDNDVDEEDAEILAVLLALIYGPALLVVGAKGSDEYWARREPGEPALPVARVDNVYQRLVGDVDAYAVRAEVGWSFAGVALEFLRHWEDDPPDKLDSWSIAGLYRFAPIEYFRADLSFGYRHFEGESRNGGFEFAVPIGIYPYSFAGVEGDLRWAFVDGSTVQDYRAGIAFRIRYAQVRAGYRLIRAGDENLNGPEVVVSLFW